MVELWCWRHPRVDGGTGRCIGRTDLAVDRRRAKRLAQRIRATARRQHLAPEVWVSPAKRCHDVGRWLRRWGWRLHVDERLRELDFGRWDGRRWDEIGCARVEAWRADLLHHAPGGGESLAALATRVHAFVAEREGAAIVATIVITHGGWINALRTLPPGCTRLDAKDWPAAPAHAALLRWRR